ncbi:phosphatase PAP2 family protein, partial [uncultured Nocardioides sp.]|uniref:phosphatase PAP2 family protein n=1 Tax=uncultured Nocardioides sp. TaxID=198441 RepID=UPI00261F3BF7
LHSHWTRERLLLVMLGIVGFYVIYVCYRNLKSFLPLVSDRMYDRELHLLDRALFFGNEPGPVLHDLLGTTVVAHFLSAFYLLFIPMVAILVTVWLVWARNISHGWWFVTAQGFAWTLGTLSYYALPTLGPGLEYYWLYDDLAHTGTTDLMNALVNARQNFRFGDGQAQTVAGFASLHTGISLLWALMVQFTVQSRLLKIVFWVNFGLTVVATLYFGWHYIVDDIAGITIAFVSFYVAGLATGQKFDHGGLASHPTTTTSKVPVSRD